MTKGLNETFAKRKMQRIQQRQATAQRIAQGLGQSILTESERQQVQTIYDGRLALEEAKVTEAQAEVAQAKIEDMRGDGNNGK